MVEMEDFKNLSSTDVPLIILRTDTKLLISTLLNSEKVLPNENGIPRDWRGLAHLINLGHDQIPPNDPNPTAKVFDLWEKQNVPYTIKTLLEFLEEIDRFDVIDDSRELIEKDVNSFLDTQNEVDKPIQKIENIDSKILTIHDADRLNKGLGPQMFDAFVAFSYDDLDFASELINRMENEYGLRLCERERDLVAGLQFEYTALIELISERCNKLVAIMSPSFMTNPVDKFLLNYAQAVGIEKNCRKIIPCVYKHCEIPPELENIYYLDYQRPTHRINFWDKLHSSIYTPTQITLSPPPIKNKRTESVTDTKPTTEKRKYLKPIMSVKKFMTGSALTRLTRTQAASSPSLNTQSGTENTLPDLVPGKKSSLIPQFLRKSSLEKPKVKEKKKRRLKLKIPVSV